MNKEVQQIYKVDYPNLMQCFQRNTNPFPIIKSDLTDKIDGIIQSENIDKKFEINTNIKFEEAGLFKECIPEALNDTLFNNPNILRKFGRIRCLTSQGEYLAVGSNLGAVLNIHIGEGAPKGYSEIRREVQGRIFSVYAMEICQCDHGSVNNLSFNKSSTQLSVGFDNGTIGIFDLLKNKNIKWLKIHQHRIVSLQYINDLMLVTSDEAGNTFITRICKGTLFYDVDSQLIMKMQSIACIRGLPDKFKQLFYIPDNSIFALANGSKCWVLRVCDGNVNSVSILWETSNEQATNNQCLVDWGMEKVNGKEQLLLGIVWNKSVKPYYYSQMEKQDGKLIAKFILIKDLAMDSNLVYLNSVYKNLFLILSEKGNMFTTNLQISNIQKVMQLPKFDILPLMYWKDNKYESQYSCCIANNEIVQEIYILLESQIIVLKYYNFEDKFRHFLEQNSYQLCFQLLLCAHKKVFMEIDRVVLLQLTTQIVTLYIQVIGRLKFNNQNQEAYERMISLIQLILELQAEPLFSQIDNLLEKILNDKGVLFLQSLRPFIINKQIKIIPDDTLMKMFTLLKQNQERSIINLLLKQLDINKVNSSVFLQACLENSLFEPMIELCTQPNKNEFLTPLFQIWSYSIKQMELGNFNEEIIYLRKSIAYMEFLLKGTLLNGDQLPQSQHFSLIEMMIVWLFEEQNLQRLITLDPNSAFELLYKIFQLTTVQLIQFTHQQNMRIIKLVVKDYLNPQYKQNFKENHITMLKSRRQQQMLQINGKENYQIETAYSYFLLRVRLILKLKVEFDEMMQVLLFCAYNKSFLFQIDYKAYAEVIDKIELPQLEMHQDHSNLIEYFHQKLLLKITILVEELIDSKEEKEQVEFLNNFQELTTFALVQAYLNAQNQEYIRPISAMLRSNNPLISKQVFKFLQTNLQQLNIRNEKQMFSNLNQAIIDKLQDLIKMDIKITRNLICQYQRQNEQLVIEKLKQNKQQQLEYIETLIQQDSVIGIKIDNEILKLHIDLLCQERPQDVLLQLQQMDYPLEDALKICQKHKNLDSTAYILERLGVITEAMEIQQMLLNQQVEQLMIKLKNFDPIPEQLWLKLDKKMEDILYVCVKNNKFDNSEDVWYQFLDNLLFLADQTNQDETSQVKDIIIHRIGTLFEDIAVHSCLELFAQNLDDKYRNLYILNYKNNFMRILNTFYYQVNFIQNIKTIVNQCYSEEKNTLMLFNVKGYGISGYCDICGDKAQIGILFQCGHYIHFDCYKNQQICPKCLQSEQFYLEQIAQKQKLRMNKLTHPEREVQMNLTQQIEQSKIRILKQQQQPLAQQGQSLRNKLNLFDISRQQHYDQIRNLRDIL